jgi:hypothetical protein
MGKIIHRVTFHLQDDVCRELETLVPLAQRNQLINEVLRKELGLVRLKHDLAALLQAEPDKQECSA